MVSKLQQLGVIPSYGRPGVSDDNPHIESVFKTLKYRSWYPKRPFNKIEDANLWVEKFVKWYNFSHLHSALGFVTPESMHTGKAEEILANRREVYRKAREANPERWSGQTRSWSAPTMSFLNFSSKKINKNNIPNINTATSLA
jgi:hypothetical protein